MELFKSSKQLINIINFIKLRKIVCFLSITLCLLSVSSLIFQGLNLSLEFVGGTQLEIRFNKSININQIILKLEQANFKNPKIQYYGSTKDFIIRLANDKSRYSKKLDLVKDQISYQVIEALNTSENPVNLRKIEYVGSEVGEKLLEQGGIAIVIAILVTMLYIAIRFEFRLAISAAATLCHNAIIVLGCFSIMRYEFDLSTLAAILAIIGYSLNDTIVIFDRVRENLRKFHKQSIQEIINISINQTLSRTIMTSCLTLLVVLSLLFFGGKSLFGFSFVLTIGIIVGTYASICLAGNFAIWCGLSRKDFLKR